MFLAFFIMAVITILGSVIWSVVKRNSNEPTLVSEYDYQLSLIKEDKQYCDKIRYTLAPLFDNDEELEQYVYDLYAAIILSFRAVIARDREIEEKRRQAVLTGIPGEFNVYDKERFDQCEILQVGERTFISEDYAGEIALKWGKKKLQEYKDSLKEVKIDDRGHLGKVVDAVNENLPEGGKAIIEAVYKNCVQPLQSALFHSERFRKEDAANAIDDHLAYIRMQENRFPDDFMPGAMLQDKIVAIVEQWKLYKQCEELRKGKPEPLGEDSHYIEVVGSIETQKKYDNNDVADMITEFIESKGWLMSAHWSAPKPVSEDKPIKVNGNGDLGTGMLKIKEEEVQAQRTEDFVHKY